MDLDGCIPSHKSDLAAVKRAGEVGYPDINPILPQLLEWLQDGNWPVAHELAHLLSGAGPEIAPHIRAIVNSDDDLWKYWIVTLLGPRLRQDVWERIEPGVMRLARAPTAGEKAEEVDVEAAGLLALRSGKSS